MRKALVLPAAVLAAVCCFASPAAASSQVRKQTSRHRVAAKSTVHHHKSAKRAKKHRKVGVARSDGARRPHARIYPSPSGRVTSEKLDTAYGPLPGSEVQDYPQPLCEPIDAVVEVRLHDAEVEEEGEPPAARVEVAGEPAAREPASLSRIAKKLGSFFRPKSSEAVVKPKDVDLSELLSEGFLIPVDGVNPEKLQDSFLSSRGRHHKHLAIDIGAPRGTPVLATTDGEVVRIIRERRGGKSIYQKDATGQYLLFYCHLSRYADDLSAGQRVKRGQVIGYVGSTGHVIGGSHLHFSITRLPDDARSLKKGLAINPYLLFLAEVP